METHSLTNTNDKDNNNTNNNTEPVVSDPTTVDLAKI